MQPSNNSASSKVKVVTATVTEPEANRKSPDNKQCGKDYGNCEWNRSQPEVWQKYPLCFALRFKMATTGYMAINDPKEYIEKRWPTNPSWESEKLLTTIGMQRKNSNPKKQRKRKKEPPTNVCKFQTNNQTKKKRYRSQHIIKDINQKHLGM